MPYAVSSRYATPPLPDCEAFLDRVLVRAAEGRVHEVSDVRMPRVDLDAVAVLDGAPDLVDVGEVDHRVDALRVQIERECGDVDVAGALAVAEDAPFDALGPGEHGQLGAGDSGAAVVVRVDRQDHRIATGEVSMHVLDLVGVHVRCRDLDGGGEVQDDGAPGRGIPHGRHRFADLEHVVGLGQVEHLGRELEADIWRVAREAQHVLTAREDELCQLGAVAPQHDIPPHRRGRGVHVDDDLVADAADRRDRPLDQVASCGREHDDRDVVGREIGLGDQPHEVVVGLGGGGIADLDLLVAHRHEQLEEATLALGIHGFGEGLVAVTEVDGRPQRCGREAVGGPAALGCLICRRDVDARERVTVPVRRHLRLALPVPEGRIGGDGARGRGEAGGGVDRHGSSRIGR
ncbi:MAG: hypothetical protein K0S70_3070 [Microbacterium sp.]|nr:hypothetical protein [Microbacterium sp.]